MINLLKSDFYKMKRHKAFYISMFVVVLYVAYIVIDFQSSTDMKELISPSTFHWVYLIFEEVAFLPYVMTLVQSIFITIFITDEYQTGTIKDPVALGFNRTKIYFSKFIVLSLASLIIMLLAVLTIALTATIVFGIYGTFTLYDFWLMSRMLLFQGLLFSAYGAMFLVLSLVIKNAGAAMAINLIFSLVLLSVSSLVGDNIWGRMFLIMNIEPIAMPQPQLIDALITMGVTIAYLLLVNGIGALIFNKQDIK